MTKSGDPKESPVAERVNGIIKKEIIGEQNLGSFPEALKKWQMQ
ncbi:hypothetical protein [Turicimonas sp. TL08]